MASRAPGDILLASLQQPGSGVRDVRDAKPPKASLRGILSEVGAPSVPLEGRSGPPGLDGPGYAGDASRRSRSFSSSSTTVTEDPAVLIAGSEGFVARIAEESCLSNIDGSLKGCFETPLEDEDGLMRARWGLVNTNGIW